MRLYFHLLSDTEILWDKEGVEIDEVERALGDAQRAVDEIRAEEPTAPEEWFGWMLNITDETGRTLLWIDLGRRIQ